MSSIVGVGGGRFAVFSNGNWEPVGIKTYHMCLKYDYVYIP